MAALKYKLLGLILVILGVWPFLLKISSVAAFFSQYKILSYIVPGEIVYQLILIVLGVLLLWRKKARVIQK